MANDFINFYEEKLKLVIRHILAQKDKLMQTTGMQLEGI